MDKNNNEINFFNVAKILFNRKIYIAFSIGIPLLLAIIYVFIATPQYSSYISINPVNEHSNNAVSGLQGIASTIGMDIGANDNSSFYIPDIVNSRILKEAIIYNKWNTKKYNDNVNLIDYWEIGKDSGFSFRSLFINNKHIIKDIEDLESALGKLTQQISVTEEESGLMIISVLMEEPKLAADIANYIANYVKSYISEEMTLQSTKFRIFIEERLKSSKIDLRVIEEKLNLYRKNHPLALDTPDLQLERARLIRDVEINQEVYLTLLTQYELAKIEELKETPVINVLDNAEAPIRKDSPKRKLLVILGLISGLFFGSMFTLLKYFTLDQR